MFGMRSVSVRCALGAGLIAKMAAFSHMDADTNPHPSVGLLRGWKHGYDSEGRVYYYSEEGGSTWDRPVGSSAYTPSSGAEVKNGTHWDTEWDMRGKNKNKVVHQIVMVRHGQYDRDGRTDAEHTLTAIGRQQAEATGKRLNALFTSGQLAPPKTVYFSTMTRATETCQLILPQIAPSAAPLTLASSSSAAGTGSAAATLSMRVEACSMIREGAVCRPSPPCTGWDPTEEDFEKEGARVLAAFKNHVHRAAEDEENNYSTVLVCHGNVIRYFTMKALQLPPEAWLRLNVYNGSITIMEVRANGNVSLRTLGDTGHLPTELITYN